MSAKWVLVVGRICCKSALNRAYAPQQVNGNYPTDTIAAKQTNHPVKLVITRQQMFTATLSKTDFKGSKDGHDESCTHSHSWWIGNLDQPFIETVLPLSEARRAQEMSQSGRTRGKIVLQVVD